MPAAEFREEAPKRRCNGKLPLQETADCSAVSRGSDLSERFKDHIACAMRQAGV
jgi:hypothetical protein